MHNSGVDLHLEFLSKAKPKDRRVHYYLFENMGESRNELLAWLNDLTQLGYTKVEQCGSGAAHCAIIDSIYRDVSLFSLTFIQPVGIKVSVCTVDSGS